jgi:hypothetical protein
LAIGLGATLATTQRTGLHRFGQMPDRAGALQRASDEQPAGARLHRCVHLSTSELTGPFLDRCRGRGDPPARDLPGH